MAARTSQLLLSFSTVIKVVIGEERCVTTLITAAREIINHDDLPQKMGDCEQSKEWCTSQALLTQLESFCRAIYGNKNGIAELTQRRNGMSSTFKKEEAGFYQLLPSEDSKDPSTPVGKGVAPA